MLSKWRSDQRKTPPFPKQSPDLIVASHAVKRNLIIFWIIAGVAETLKSREPPNYRQPTNVAIIAEHGSPTALAAFVRRAKRQRNAAAPIGKQRTS
ncbi:hypothetical protein EWD52_23395 [Salmonella enterica subsp. enterica serovar Braenderup]|nr:hypothetical protein [Salmonella enterica subsp. enterica serovar Braenderup]ECD1500244.1 hypothetical protein [Salmonella enterica subsp. enterica serovar Braenderup]